MVCATTLRHLDFLWSNTTKHQTPNTWSLNVTRALRSSADTTRLLVPPTRIKLQDNSFQICGPSLWNSLPVDIRCSQSLLLFKSALKTFLFDRAYPGVV